jgi:hypothetical protein
MSLLHGRLPQQAPLIIAATAHLHTQGLGPLRDFGWFSKGLGFRVHHCTRGFCAAGETRVVIGVEMLPGRGEC